MSGGIPSLVVVESARRSAIVVLHAAVALARTVVMNKMAANVQLR